MAQRSKLKWTLYAVVLLILVAAVVFLMGPREPVNTKILFDPAAIGEDIDAYLEKQEAKYDDIRPGLQKKIIWAYPNSKAKTPLSLVYVHGFSASLGELDPLTEIVARNIQANVYYTRLKGHGRSNDAMGEADVQGWLDDLAEAIEVGRRIGERVILIGTSTGGTLVSWAADKPRLVANVAGIINVSPNFGPQAAGSQLLTMPWARHLVKLIVGERRSFEPINELHKKYWTYEYPSTALLPMGQMIKLTDKTAFHNVQIPALFIFSDQDSTVRPEKTRIVAEKWGASSEIVTVENSDDPDNHVIAGDALSPSTTQELSKIITQWINQL